ncbi:hypothetical protein Vadar_011759 [Vaccinium darrowii]|uniref:Uncharacterized protein n=1 Tax=Vaccinium darrowii TaxID=229202 RepID=A0ACB7XQ97_9ERIC|nr:hypothetical protein Vadar_011759 [Vaccinium darrowii]
MSHYARVLKNSPGLVASYNHRGFRITHLLDVINLPWTLKIRSLFSLLISTSPSSLRDSISNGGSRNCFFTSLLKKLAAHCDSVKPVVANPTTTENTYAITKWIDEDFLCKNYILNALADDLYDYYSSFGTVTELWDALQKRYDMEEARTKKYDVSRYLKFAMLDENSVVAQAHDLQKIADEITFEGMVIDEQFQVANLIDKLPLSWKDFKKNLCHKTKEFSLETLISRLRMEEEARKQDLNEEVCLKQAEP